MEVEKAVFYDEKKFMWDGNVYSRKKNVLKKKET
jgi:hypothetical protein